MRRAPLPKDRNAGRHGGLGLLLAACAAGTAGCPGGNTPGEPEPPQPTYRVVASVSGLAGSGLVLHSSLGDDLAVPASGALAFPTRAPRGTVVTIGVTGQPTAPWQTCTVPGGPATVGSEDLNVVVTCATDRFRVGGTVGGLAGAGLVLRNGGDDLAVATSGPFAFGTWVASGNPYAVTVATQPTSPWQTCGVSRGSGTVTDGDVTSVEVSCATRSFAIEGTVRGLIGSGLVLRNGAELLLVSSGGAFAFTTPVASGASYAVTVSTPPAAPSQACTVVNGSGTVGGAKVTDVVVQCSSAFQTWTAPTTWGGLWSDGPTMIQHARFDASGVVSDKGPALAMVGGSEPTPFALGGLPGGTRYGGGPFPTEAVSYRGANASALDRPDDMLVCAVVKPARNRPYDQFEAPIVSKGLGDGTNTLAGGGWQLMQMHQSWCFHYEYMDANGDTHQFMSPIPDFFADQDFFGTLVPPQHLEDAQREPNPSYVVVCGGRDGDRIVVAANSTTLGAMAEYSLTRTQDQLSPNPYPGPYRLDAAVTRPLTIGGHDATSSELQALYPGFFEGEHTFDGFVYETGVWAEPATRENIQAKLAPFLGLAPGSTYARNREAAVVGSDGRLHVVGRHAPRLDPAKGQLFGLQSWNRVSYWVEGNAYYPYPMVFAAGENLELWAKTPATIPGAPSVVLDAAVKLPIDTPLKRAQLVTLPPGASLSIELDQAPSPGPAPPPPRPHSRARATWDATGPIQGQLWLRPASAGTLRIQKTDPAPGRGGSCTVLGVAGIPCESKDVSLSALAPAQWTRVSLAGAFTADAAVDASGRTLRRGTLVLTNPGSGTLAFHAWGVQLTQLGGGGDLGSFDPAELMYDWSASRANDGEPPDDPWYAVDVLRLAPVAESTAATGFCLGVEASMPAGLSWSAPFARSRTTMAWVNDPRNPVRLARLYVAGQDGTPDAGRLCFAVTGAGEVCAPVPASWPTDGAAHRLAGCMSPPGQLRLHADGALLATASGGVFAPNLSGGTILVGNGEVRAGDQLTPWHGYVSRALVCRDTGDGADCR